MPTLQRMRAINEQNEAKKRPSKKGHVHLKIEAIYLIKLFDQYSKIRMNRPLYKYKAAFYGFQCISFKGGTSLLGSVM